MARIVLHIGTHKTGTTTIQATLAANRRPLARCGIIYPKTGGPPPHHVLATHWMGGPSRWGFISPLRRWQKIVARHAGTDATVLLSSELFSRRRPPSVNFAELAEMLAPFDERLVVCALRNQVAYLQSIFLQISRKAPAKIGPFLNGALRPEYPTGVFLDYGALYDRLLTGFAPEEIAFFSYENAVRAPGGILGALFKRAGLPAVALTRLSRDSNVSPDPLAFWAASQLSAPVPADLVARAQEALAATFGDASTTLYTRAEVTRIAAHFAPLNAAFEARYRAIDPDFALAPLALAPGVVYRNQLGPSFWNRLRDGA
jgi:hypothetical protein